MFHTGSTKGIKLLTWVSEPQHPQRLQTHGGHWGFPGAEVGLQLHTLCWNDLEKSSAREISSAASLDSGANYAAVMHRNHSTSNRFHTCLLLPPSLLGQQNCCMDTLHGHTARTHGTASNRAQRPDSFPWRGSARLWRGFYYLMWNKPKIMPWSDVTVSKKEPAHPPQITLFVREKTSEPP